MEDLFAGMIGYALGLASMMWWVRRPRKHVPLEGPDRDASGLYQKHKAGRLNG